MERSPEITSITQTSNDEKPLKFEQAIGKSSLASRRSKFGLSIKTEELNDEMMRTGVIPNLEYICERDDQDQA